MSLKHLADWGARPGAATKGAASGRVRRRPEARVCAQAQHLVARGAPARGRIDLSLLGRGVAPRFDRAAEWACLSLFAEAVTP
jgi:hypothetical protein